MKRTFWILFFAGWLIGAVSSQGIGAPTSYQAVAGRFSCQCGCGMNLAACNHVECAFRDRVGAQIQAQLAAGVPEEKVVNQLVAAYGIHFLADPPKKGFFLLAWFVPLLFLLGGGWLIQQWIRRRGEPGTVAIPQPSLSPEKEQALADALQAYDLEEGER